LLLLGYDVTPQAQLRDRSKRFAIEVIRLCKSLPLQWDVQELGRQLLRSATSIAANYRACSRARSDREFCSKMGTVVEEADETQLWIELLPEAHPGLDGVLQRSLLKEATELVAIFTASHRTATANLERRKAEKKKARVKPSTRAQNYPITRLPDYPITRLPDYPITRLPDYPITRLPDYPTICAIVCGLVRIVIRCRAFVM